jgi:hypothetical protein
MRQRQAQRASAGRQSVGGGKNMRKSQSDPHGGPSRPSRGDRPSFAGSSRGDRPSFAGSDHASSYGGAASRGSATDVFLDFEARERGLKMREKRRTQVVSQE